MNSKGTGTAKIQCGGWCPFGGLKLDLLGEQMKKQSFGVVKGGTVIGTEVRLTYTIPMPPKGISLETVGVPPIVHYGGQ